MREALVITVDGDQVNAHYIERPNPPMPRRRLISRRRNIRGRIRKRNVAGYKEAQGIFHPIRWDPDYDPEEVGETSDVRTNWSLPAEKVRFYARRGKTRKKGKAKARRRRR
jgi:hypothetical protein